MIPNRWYVIYDSDKLKPGQAVGIRRLGENLVLWRNETGEVSCLADRCVHRGAALSQGQVREGCIECPFHGFLFNGDGRCTRIPANGKQAPVPPRFNAKRIHVRDRHRFVWMYWGSGEPSSEELPFFNDIDESYSYTTLESPIAVHYTRAIENQLDVVHLPFVHKKTIGRGGRTLVVGPKILVEGDSLFVWVKNAQDLGQPLPSEADAQFGGLQDQHLEFRFPATWQNWLTPKFRIFLSFTPVDDGNTLQVMRVYQKFVTFPVLRKLVDATMLWSSRKILAEDNFIVTRQQPAKTTRIMDERLIHGDLPIVRYREIRERLLSGATDAGG